MRVLFLVSFGSIIDNLLPLSGLFLLSILLCCSLLRLLFSPRICRFPLPFLPVLLLLFSNLCYSLFLLPSFSVPYPILNRSYLPIIDLIRSIHLIFRLLNRLSSFLKSVFFNSSRLSFMFSSIFLSCLSLSLRAASYILATTTMSPNHCAVPLSPPRQLQYYSNSGFVAPTSEYLSAARKSRSQGHS